MTPRRGSRVIGAEVRCKLLVALQLEVSHHFVEGFPRRRRRRIKTPGAFRASKTTKTLFFDPYNVAGHPPLEVGL